MKLLFKHDGGDESMRGEADNASGALEAGLALCKHWGGSPVRIYEVHSPAGELSPLGVVTYALVETEEDLEALGA